MTEEDLIMGMVAYLEVLGDSEEHEDSEPWLLAVHLTEILSGLEIETGSKSCDGCDRTYAAELLDGLWGDKQAVDGAGEPDCWMCGFCIAEYNALPPEERYG